MTHTIVTLVRNHPGVLNRAISLFRLRNVTVESINVARTGTEDVSSITWTLDADDIAAVMRKMEKLVDVISVSHVGSQPSVSDSHLSCEDALSTPSPNAITQADGVA